VARAARATSVFGAELDSLADAVSFGVAPAGLLFNWGREPLGAWGVVVSFVYVACTLVRLARFNVIAHQDNHVRSYFTGLPSPLAAGGVVAVVVAQLAATGRATTQATFSVALLAILLGALMVSNVRYRTYKDINFRGKGGIALLTLAALTLVVGVVARPSTAIVLLMMLYILGGLVGGIASLGRHLFIHDDSPDSGLLLDEDTST
ncbi:MAG: CDP-alcohol phosphatidyltransferase family protein, partial [Myxococcota bacterium]